MIIEPAILREFLGSATRSNFSLNWVLHVGISIGISNHHQHVCVCTYMWIFFLMWDWNVIYFLDDEFLVRKFVKYVRIWGTWDIHQLAFHIWRKQQQRWQWRRGGELANYLEHFPSIHLWQLHQVGLSLLLKTIITIITTFTQLTLGFCFQVSLFLPFLHKLPSQFIQSHLFSSLPLAGGSFKVLPTMAYYLCFLLLITVTQRLFRLQHHVRGHYVDDELKGRANQWIVCKSVVYSLCLAQLNPNGITEKYCILFTSWTLAKSTFNLLLIQLHIVLQLPALMLHMGKEIKSKGQFWQGIFARQL